MRNRNDLFLVEIRCIKASATSDQWTSKMFSIVTIFYCISALFVEPAIPTVQDLTCSNVEISFCKNVLPLNETYKTPLSKAQQEEMYLQYYNPLVNINCSSFSRRFVCTVHFPFCSSHREPQPLLPCRSVCLDVYSRCFKHFCSIVINWPGQSI